MTLVEKEAQLGGNLLHVYTTLSGEETAPKLAALMNKVTEHANIRTFTNAKIKNVAGYVGIIAQSLPHYGGEGIKPFRMSVGVRHT